MGQGSLTSPLSPSRFVTHLAVVSCGPVRCELPISSSPHLVVSASNLYPFGSMASISGVCCPSSSSALRRSRPLLPRKPIPSTRHAATIPIFPSGRSSHLRPARSIADISQSPLTSSSTSPPPEKKTLGIEKDPIKLWRRYVDWLYQHKELGLFLDVSRIAFTDEFLAEMEPRLQKAFHAMQELEKGAIANPDEGRMVGHYWLRDPKRAPNSFLRLQIENTLDAICKFADDIISATIKPPSSPAGRFTQILSVGIGGSALGPQFVAEALAPDNPPLKVFIYLIQDMVVLPYKDSLLLFSRYLQQLVMESLGKEFNLDGNRVFLFHRLIKELLFMEIKEAPISMRGYHFTLSNIFIDILSLTVIYSYLLVNSYIQQLREGVHNFFVTFIEVLRDRPPGHDWELEPGVTSGDYLFGMLQHLAQGTRSALYANDRESISVTVQEVTPRSVGALVALYERAVGIYAYLININAYHQPGMCNIISLN
ncbi:hypothetical protein B296_00039491 [Ensete ventricosum]|uniref:Glucose-6-phosphate isomerase n=1 Tax=Ensete ventricosum TaxID=4639 RepID=A0A426ZT35_ENSVE|nr:hypothetical protein B296_00039491 [Ensete ventricosum]